MYIYPNLYLITEFYIFNLCIYIKYKLGAKKNEKFINQFAFMRF